MKCFYHTDPDGQASAFAVKRRHAGEKIEWVPIRAGSPLFIDKIDAGEKVYIVDLSFKPEEFKALLVKTPDVVWVDHHKPAMRPEYSEFELVPGARAIGAAACVLTWGYLFPDETIPRAIKLLGDYDIWKFEYGDESKYFMAATRLYDLAPDSPFWCDLFTVRHYMVKMIEQGKTVLQYERMTDHRTLNAIGYDIEFEGLKCLVANVPFKGSEFFASAEEGKYDMFIAWSWQKDSYYVGLRSDKVDVAEVARKHGGDGHRGAAGFKCAELPWIINKEKDNG